VRFLAPPSQDRTPASRYSPNSPLATNYRESGLVHRPFPDIQGGDALTFQNALMRHVGGLRRSRGPPDGRIALVNPVRGSSSSRDIGSHLAGARRARLIADRGALDPPRYLCRCPRRTASIGRGDTAENYFKIVCADAFVNSRVDNRRRVATLVDCGARPDVGHCALGLCANHLGRVTLRGGTEIEAVLVTIIDTASSEERPLVTDCVPETENSNSVSPRTGKPTLDVDFMLSVMDLLVEKLNVLVTVKLSDRVKLHCTGMGLPLLLHV
jgi:hypothetical protein